MKTGIGLAVYALLMTAALAGCTSPGPADAPLEAPNEGSASSAPVASSGAPAPATTETTPAKAGQNPYPIPSKSTSVVGSGATFPKPLLETWGIEFARLQPTVQVSYAGGGSGKGISDITAKTVLFAGSDAPMSVAEKEKAGPILHIPETLGLVAVVYRVDGVSAGLRLDGETVGQIYLGKIAKWNDPKIAALNPGVALPDKSVAIVYRSDSSGTTFVFTDWLSKTSSSWSATMGATANKKPDWTKSSAVQLSGNGNDGVGSMVKSTPNSIGYVELAYVKSLALSAAAVKNKAGEYVSPTTDGASRAAATLADALPAASGDWSTVSIIDAAGPGSYPVSSLTYILVYGSLADYNGAYTANQMNAMRAWLWWGLHGGQGYSPALGYAPLPASVVKIGEDALNAIQV